MKRITAVFPTRAEAEATFESLRSLNLAQEAVRIQADSSYQVNPSADDSRSSDSNSDSLAVQAIPIIGGLGGLGVGTGNSMGSGPTSAYAVAALSGMSATPSDSSTRTDNTDRSVSDSSSTLEEDEETQYYSNAIAQGHAVLSVDLESDEHEAFVRQVISQNQGHPFIGTPV